MRVRYVLVALAQSLAVGVIVSWQVAAVVAASSLATSVAADRWPRAMLAFALAISVAAIAYALVVIA